MQNFDMLDKCLMVLFMAVIAMVGTAVLWAGAVIAGCM